MKGLLSSLSAATLAAMLSVPVQAATEEPTSSAWQWLELIDHGKYSESWAEGSALFRARITERSWESKIQIFHDAVGSIVWRDVLGVSSVADPKGLPKGLYQVVHYKSKFTDARGKKSEYEETVTLILENGLYRVATYDVK
ncbi:hypothetical protein FHS83_003429 [Rhizomicrobium palustre]|uniref:DUF4019 domain-containing protein n=1 Tax=Rhizomicrobium palustre TaxID=189966 RepID=A0A846N4H9_9PROT|nr:DUF4019 domain-containing protein [Rhizomicrobium palustre]NIK90111.1 hypothetical protein [Rhizomicrobium palustre]